MKKRLLLGNEAVARGLYEAGVKVVSSYPGTPSTEITECMVQYPEIYSEWASNEKVAFEVTYGASMGGVRSFCAMKHVGLNVASDPLYTASYIGVNAGMVCAVADDPGIHSSQNEQDSRYHAIASKVPMLEPCDSNECKNYTKLAFEISEQFDTPVLLRLSTRISHSRSIVEMEDRDEPDNKPYIRNISKNVMLPEMARIAHEKVEKRTIALRDYAENSNINSIEYNDSEIGVIVAGSTYIYAKEVLEDNASYLKLGMVNPLPIKLIKDFAATVEKLYVIEELEDVIETHCRKYGIHVIGKELFSNQGEFSQRTIREAILGEVLPTVDINETVFSRSPVLCAGCPHRGLFYSLKNLNLFVSGDIGCYTLAAHTPFSMIDMVVCMGASISVLHGFNIARGKKESMQSIAIIGDSTFIHSGITGLIDMVYNKGISTVIILDNSTTGMTGHQNNPINGLTLKGDQTVAVNIEKLAHAIGIKHVVIVDPYKVNETRKAVVEELEKEEPSLIISKSPCVLLKNVKKKMPFLVERNKCIGCYECLKVGCPALSLENVNIISKTNVFINQELCSGCGICRYACEANAIKEVSSHK